jgi:DNA-binding SARP family transcriptional activator
MSLMREQTVVPTQLHVPSIRIATFGPFTLQRRVSAREAPPQFLTLEGRALGDRPGALLMLLKFLLCCPNRHATKAALMEALWPGVDEESAQRRFSTARSVLGKLLRTMEGSNLLFETPDGQGLYLAPQSEIEVDADAFEAAVHEASLAEQTSSPDHLVLLWQHAYDLRRGDYLPDDVDALWTEARRLSLETLYALCVQRLAALYLGREQAIEAERLLRAYWSTHLTDEEALAQLMELLASQGKRLTALRCYKLSARALRDELDVAPSEPLRVLAEQLRKQGFAQGIVAATEHIALDVVSSPSTRSLFLPEPLVTSWPQKMEGVDGITVFGEQAARMMQEVARWHGRALHCDQLQKLLNLELERWNAMTQSSDHDVLISRRTALASIAALPVAVSVAIVQGQRAPIVLETFLPECTASITACWHLMMGNGISTVAEQLPKYLPALEILAQQPSRYQKVAARLATQGCLLMGLVALHHSNLALREMYCRRAVTFSEIAEDQTLHVAALSRLADTFYYEKRPEKSLRMYEQVSKIISQPDNKVAPLLQSKVYMQAAACYAQVGQVQNALYCSGKAHEVFPEHIGKVEPNYSDCGILPMLLWEGIAYEHLGAITLDRTMPKRSKVLYMQAQNTFAKHERLAPAITAPERIRVEIINQQAATAIAQGDMELFGTYLQAGAQGAKALGSDKRMQEAIANWKAACKRWPHEQRVLELADVLL